MGWLRGWASMCSPTLVQQAAATYLGGGLAFQVGVVTATSVAAGLKKQML
jgi:hypothetical protein